MTTYRRSCRLSPCVCVSASAACCISMWTWTASAPHWPHEENSPATAGAGGGWPACAGSPWITLRWPLCTADRYVGTPTRLNVPFGFNTVPWIMRVGWEHSNKIASHKVIKYLLSSCFKVQNNRRWLRLWRRDRGTALRLVMTKPFMSRVEHALFY